MAENKTKLNNSSVSDFINSVENQQRRDDAFAALELIEDVTGLKGQMWGTAIIGFGTSHYKYESGREGDSPLVGFSPRKQNLVFYISRGFDQFDTLVSKLGKYKTGKGCLYVNKLSDVDQSVLREMVKQSVEYKKQNP